MQIVPVRAVPNQVLASPLAGQNCQINIYQKSTGLFIDIFLNGDNIIRGVICQNENRIIRDLYLGFAGDFVFYDNQGRDDPVYTGLGNRFSLVYIEPADLPDGVG